MELDTTRLNAMLRDLGTFAGDDRVDAALGFTTQKVLQGCADELLVPQETVRVGKRRDTLRVGSSLLVIERGYAGTDERDGGIAQRVWLFEPSNGAVVKGSRVVKNNFGGKTAYIMANGSPRRKWSDSRWGRYQAMLAELEAAQKGKRVKKRLKLRYGTEPALMAQGFAQIGKELGLSVNVPDEVLKATDSKGRRYVNGHGERIKNEVENSMTLIHGYPYHTPRMVGVLQRQLNRRVAAFQIELTKGVFDDLETRAKRYPGVFTT